MSTVHISLVQNGKECLAGYVSNMNLENANGITYATNFALVPPPTLFDLERLESESSDGNWIKFTFPYQQETVLKAMANVGMAVPINGAPVSNITNLLLKPIHLQDAFANEMLSSIVDMFIRPVENFRPGGFSSKRLSERGLRILARTPRKEGVDEFGLTRSQYEYPTVSLSLDIKKFLQPEGVQWLFVRSHAKEIKNRRMDMEVVILDEALELVALSHRVGLVIDLFPGEAKEPRQVDSKL